ncbi:MAG TPA: hypothetical protein VM784_06535 [Actinomycetota bacterium]|nr:hypothetical protein [Actinomycetota bacterium]
MTGAGAVLTVVLLEWTAGFIGAAAWTQSWSVVTRGHFRIIAWCALAFAALAAAANRGAVPEGIRGSELQQAFVLGVVAVSIIYALVQYSRTDLPGTAVGAAAGVLGAIALVLTAGFLSGWPQTFAAIQIVAGAVFLGGVTNGMLLGHWYLNQPGLQPWALDRLTSLSLGATVATGLLGLLAAPRLAAAETSGAVLGIPGFGESFGPAFFLIWLALVGFTGVIVLMARRCIRIRSIQSATGLLYVALLTAGVAEFLVRYLMVNAA